MDNNATGTWLAAGDTAGALAGAVFAAVNGDHAWCVLFFALAVACVLTVSYGLRTRARSEAEDEGQEKEEKASEVERIGGI